MLKQFDRNVVGCSDKGHPSVAWRSVDGYSALDQSAAGLVDIVHLVGEMTKIAAAAVTLLVPVPGELDLAASVSGNAKKDERVPALLIVDPSALAEPQ